MFTPAQSRFGLDRHRVAREPNGAGFRLRYHRHAPVLLERRDSGGTFALEIPFVLLEPDT